MDTDLLREAAQVSFYANAEACLICVVGAAAVHFRLVDQAFLKTLSRVLLRLSFDARLGCRRLCKRSLCSRDACRRSAQRNKRSGRARARSGFCMMFLRLRSTCLRLLALHAR